MNTGIYIHIPFCRQKCDYCAFYSVPVPGYAQGEDDGVIRAYVKRLLDEISLRSGPFRDSAVDTVYFGGGTPSLLDPAYLRDILFRIGENFNMDSRGVEVTVECNPEDFSIERMAEYSGFGVNRISLGVQTLNPRLNSFIGRSSAPPDENMLSEFMGVLNVAHCVDIMTAIPGQSEEELLSDLEAVGRHGFEHVSAYMLSIEKGTALYERTPDKTGHEDRDRRLFEIVIKYLKGKGYSHYEVSNFAIPSHESRHNMKYWQFYPYIGFGAGAHSFYRGRRYYNPPSIDHYIKNPAPLKKDERPDNYLIVEYIMTGMRLLKGISLNSMEKMVEQKLPGMIMDKFIELEKGGFVFIERDMDDINVRFTGDGFFIMDSLIYDITEILIEVQDKRK